LTIKIETIATCHPSSRVLAVSIGSKTIATPTYFPALSSVTIKHSVTALANLIASHAYPRMLVSGYDLCDAKSSEARNLLKSVKRFRALGGFLMVDSGWYESSWRRDAHWTLENLRKTLRNVESEFYFGFDVVLSKNYSGNMEKALQRILSSSSRSDRNFIPVFHAAEPQSLVSFVRLFEKKHSDAVAAIAVSQRDCGDEFEEKARTIRQIRSILNRESPGKLLHLLGCGDPMSLALFSFLGVDTFDSLDWVERIADYDKWTSVDISQLSLLDCKCSMCSSLPTDYLERALLHNLGFYQDFMARIRDWIRNGTITQVLQQRLKRDPIQIGV
jgi:queuine/archaeosine tRNA-ribosyltransferase